MAAVSLTTGAPSCCWTRGRAKQLSRYARLASRSIGRRLPGGMPTSAWVRHVQPRRLLLSAEREAGGAQARRMAVLGKADPQALLEAPCLTGRPCAVPQANWRTPFWVDLCQEAGTALRRLRRDQVTCRPLPVRVPLAGMEAVRCGRRLILACSHRSILPGWLSALRAVSAPGCRRRAWMTPPRRRSRRSSSTWAASTRCT